ncbi:MAG: hypothetical protein K8R90_06105 [Candidatus Cloacimonetes bacterium]|nr:hypothetical protein [Candidatus Cloacimonadota bacterium]
MYSSTPRADDINPAFFEGPGRPISVQNVETRLSRLDKQYRDNSLAIAFDYMWLRIKWKQEGIFEATQGQVTLKEYLRRISPRGIHHCYRIEKALYVITDYLEQRYSTDLSNILSSRSRMDEVEDIYDRIGITKLLLLGRECDSRDRMQATGRLVTDPHSFTIEELKLRLGKKVRRRLSTPMVSLPPQQEMTIEDRLFLIFRDIVGDEISEEELRAIIRRFGMDMLKEIKTKIRG